MYICVYVRGYLFVCVCVCVYVYIYVCIYIDIYKCFTTGKPTRSFATERVSLDSV